MDLYDDEDLPHISAILELPGIGREDMSVLVREGKLIVTGERSSPLPSRMRQHTRSLRGAEARRTQSAPMLQDIKYRSRELKFGRFRREIDIPVGTQVR